MALIKSGTFGSSPRASYELHATQTGGSGNWRNITVTMKLKVDGGSSSAYNFPLHWQGQAKDNWSNFMHVKSGETWRGTDGWREYSWGTGVDVGTTGEVDITVGFNLKRSDGGSSSWNTYQNATFRVGRTNTAPYIPQEQQWISIKNNDTNETINGVYPENVKTLRVEWGQAFDNENDSLNYSLNERVNDGGWNRADFGSDRIAYIDVSNSGSGNKRQYYVDAVDGGGLWSNKIYSAEIVKNSMSPDVISTNDSINFNTTDITFNFSGAGNTNGNTTFTRRITCNEIPLQGSDVDGSPISVEIARDSSSGRHIKFDDLKNYLKNSGYVGNLTFNLITTNAYGTSKQTTVVVRCDIRTNPNVLSSTVDDTNSRAYKKVAFSENSYYIPNGSDNIRVSWSGGTDKLGGSVTYSVYVSYNDSSWEQLANGITGTYYDHIIPKQNSQESFKYLVRSTTSYGYSTEDQTNARTLHYYNSPSISLGRIVRGSTQAEVYVTVKTNSSIPNISTVGRWNLSSQQPNSPTITSGNLSASQAEQKITATGMNDDGLYDLEIWYKDNTGFSSEAYYIVKIGANSPIFFVNKYGVGVGGVKADSSNTLNIKGRIKATGGADILGVLTADELESNKPLITWGSNSVFYGKSNKSKSIAMIYNSSLEGEYLFGGKKSDEPSDEPYDYVRVGRNKLQYTTNMTTVFDIYHTGNKPTPSAIGAIPTSSNGNYTVGSLKANSGLEFIGGSGGGNGVFNGYKDGASFQANNLKIQSWYGVGFAPSIEGQPVPYGEYSHYFNTRNGDFSARRNIKANGNIYASNIIAEGNWMQVDGNGKNLGFGTSGGDCFITNSVSGRFLQFEDGGNLAYNGSFVSSSDATLKEDIVYISDNNLLSEGNNTQFKDFIKEFKPAQFKYKSSTTNTYGFIAQDVYNSQVGKLFTRESEIRVSADETKKSLVYDIGAYITVVATALKEEIIEKDNIIKDLTSRIEKLENK